MVPPHIVLLDRFPLSPNGKVDRRALPAPPPIESGPVEEMTPLERVLAAIFAEVLELDQLPALDDNFFDLGGHSLRATQLISRVRDFLHLELPLREFLEEPTLAATARAIERIAENSKVNLSEIVGALREVLSMDEAEVQERLNVTEVAS
jgi:acyl carrier protein